MCGALLTGKTFFGISESTNQAKDNLVVLSTINTKRYIEIFNNYIIYTYYDIYYLIILNEYLVFIPSNFSQQY